MKKLLPLFFVLLVFGCSKKDDPEPKNELSGTKWAAFAYKSVFDGSNVYKIFHFKPNGTVEYYSAQEKSSIIGDIDVYTYTYSPPTISLKIKDKNVVAEFHGNFIRYDGKDYEKM